MEKKLILPKKLKSELFQKETKQIIQEVLLSVKDDYCMKNRLSSDMTLQVCKIVHDIPKLSKNNVDEKCLALDILQELFSLNGDEVLFIKDQVEFIHKYKLHKKLNVKKIAKYTWAFLKRIL